MLEIIKSSCKIFFIIISIFYGSAFANDFNKQVEDVFSNRKKTNFNNLSSKKIIFIHGMFSTPKVWDKWQNYYKELGYETIAPAWPLHDIAIEKQRSGETKKALGQLTLDEVIENYRDIIRNLPDKPIVIGHSMGGLIAQKLLSEGIVDKAIAINSAPPSGLFVTKWSFIKSNWPLINPFVNSKKPYYPSRNEMKYSFTNCLSDNESNELYNLYIVPESRLVGRGTISKSAKIDFNKSHKPLLIISGGKDNIIPSSLNRKNFNKYTDGNSVSDFYQFNEKCHSLIVDHGWVEVADYINDWLDKN